MRKCSLFILVCLLTFISVVPAFSKDNKINTDGKGYLGTLPELTREYGIGKNDNEEEQKPVKAIPSKDFNSQNEIKPIPNDDPAFVNMILKTDKTSKYANDLNEFVATLENIYDMIEDNENVQLFNAKVFYFNKLAGYFRDKYADKPESQFISYKRILELSIHARSIALLRNEAEKYNPYLAYGSSGYIYNPNNIEEQLGYLKTEIQQTILIIRESQ